MNQNVRQATQAKFEDWSAHPVTVAFLQFLMREQEALKARWAGGEFTHVEQYATAISNAKAIGQCEMIERILALEPEQFISVIGE